ncbi:MAG TPA: hypothetical protein VLH61_09935, partial [Bacteroidales bacterium]|nr:hypothetical protein [Bacteroidales bacterium]
MLKNVFAIILLCLVLSLPVIGQIQNQPRNDFFDRRTVTEREPATLPYVREADILWKRRVWQVLDLREKINQPLYFPVTPSDGRRSFMQVIVDGIRDGEITAFDVVDEEFNVPLTPDQLFSRLERTQTITMQRPTPPYEEFDTTLV